MALPQMYAVQTDIPSGLQEHYVEKDGHWVLETDPPMEDVTALKTTVQQERTLRRESDKALSELKVKFEGVDPDEFHKLQDRVKGLDDADVYDKQGIEALVQRRTDAMKAEHERQLASKDREVVQSRTQATEFERRWRQDRIKNALLDAVTKGGVYEKAVDDAVQRGLGVFTDLDDEGLVVAKRGEDVVYGKDGINPLRPNEWISTLKASGDAPHLWPASSGGGAPAHHSANGQQIDWSKYPPAERLTMFRQQEEAKRNR